MMDVILMAEDKIKGGGGGAGGREGRREALLWFQKDDVLRPGEAEV